MTWRLLEDMPDRTEWLQYDEGTDTSVVKTTWKNVENTIELNKATQGKDAGITPDDDNPGWHHVARIPVYLIERWLREEGLDVFNRNHGPALMRKLDDPEYRFLRVNTGQIGIRKKMA